MTGRLDYRDIKDVHLRSAKKDMAVATGLKFKTNGDGSGRWLLRFSLRGQQQGMSLGSYPAVSLADARTKATENLLLAKRGRDPRVAKEKAVKAETSESIRFRDVAAQFFKFVAPTLKTEKLRTQYWRSYELHVFPTIGDVALADIDAMTLAEMVEDKWHSSFPTADRALKRVSKVLTWAHGARYKCDPLAVSGARIMLQKSTHKVKPHKAMDYNAVPQFYATLGEDIAQLGQRFSMLTASRPGVVVNSTWDEIEEPKANIGWCWCLDAARMKRDDEHEVPLSDEAVRVLELASRFNPDRTGYIFPRPTAWKTGHISNNGWTQQMRRLGITATSHGFRASFRTWTAHKILEGVLHPEDRIHAEEALHHKVRSETELAYMRGQLGEMRRPLLQAWSDFVTDTSEGRQTQLRIVR